MEPWPTATCGRRPPRRPPPFGAGAGALMSTSCRCMEEKRPGYFKKYSAATKPAVIVDIWNCDQLGIEQLEQQVVGPFAIHHRELEALVVQPLLHAGIRRHRGDLVVFVGRPLHLAERRVVAPVPVTQRRGDHLR